MCLLGLIFMVITQALLLFWVIVLCLLVLLLREICQINYNINEFTVPVFGLKVLCGCRLPGPAQEATKVDMQDSE